METTTLQKFNEFNAEIATVLDESKELTIVDNKTYNGCRSARTNVQAIISAIEQRRKELKEPLIKMGKEIDNTAKELTPLLIERKAELIDKIKVWDDKKEAERKEKERLEKERVDKILTWITEFKDEAHRELVKTTDIPTLSKMKAGYESMEMGEEIFQEYVEFARQSVNIAIQAVEMKISELKVEAAKKYDQAKQEYFLLKGEEAMLDETLSLENLLKEIESIKETNRLDELRKQREERDRLKNKEKELEEREKKLQEQTTPEEILEVKKEEPPVTIRDKEVVDTLHKSLEADRVAIINYVDYLLDTSLPLPEIKDEDLKTLLADFYQLLETNIYNLKQNIKNY